ncbi:hypothetical protein [Actinoalloteichus hymeniacidonis]|jgi:hypothetical protein|uniref:Secreted protein n=1 Tax=Actinoalloteichus hymeniacidonis TaxID=340345 RepID=A0AAC9HNU7_9PSEU|nr:hypothetical protein [Actinoalloteichus hymeniacidonis]AOS62658.1 hypothetical protein TL08_09215 [Actinoalloteichus hymeniacidonis]MBB5909310.1 hypothetical protein [Actinoalloteichus hymeniacidonis]
MRTLRKSLYSLLAAVGIMLTMGGFTTASANTSENPETAAVSCSGHITYSRTHPSGLGELVIYYNSSNGGTNSACFYHRGAAYGVPANTSVQIVRCTQTSGEGQACTADQTSRRDTGNFSFYAGPVGVTGTAARCVAAAGYIDWNGVRYSMSSGRQGCPN